MESVMMTYYSTEER